MERFPNHWLLPRRRGLTSESKLQNISDHIKTRDLTRNDYDFLTAFKRIQRDVNALANEKGWWEDGREDGTCIALMHSELSEGLEALRKDLESDKIAPFMGIEEELADTIIRIMDFAEQMDLQVAEAVLVKHEFNRHRAHKHGGKKF